jgi:hypothetical protein
MASREELVKIALAHAQAEADGDLEATLATMEPEPVYTLLPWGRQFTGMANTRAYYRHFFDGVLPHIQGYTMLNEWVNDNGLAQEYTIRIRHKDGQVREHQVFSILTFGPSKVSGERLYADQAFFEFLFGPLGSELKTI